MIHSKKHPVWINAAGDQVPVKFVPKNDIEKEKLAADVLAAALKASEQLAKLHAKMLAATEAVKAMVKEQLGIEGRKGVGKGKGSLTWYSFDKSIKIEADMNEISRWDEPMMAEALNLLNTYLNENLSDANILIKGLVSDAFSSNKGTIDTKKVFQLLKYEDQIKDKNFQSACKLIRKAQDVDRTKLYMRIATRQEDGSYKYINLNFSAI